MILGFMAVSALSACNKILEEYPEYELVGENAIVDEKSAFTALNGVYGYLQLAYTRTYGATGGTLPFDVMVSSALRAGLIQGGSVMENLQRTLWVDPTVAGLTIYYQECYKIINAANNVLYYTDRLPASKISDEAKISIQAQARFLRGLGHFWVLRFYGYFWDNSSPYGVVIREEPSTYGNQQKARSTVLESFEKIIDDFQYCIEHGSTVPTSVFKASQHVAKAYLMETLLIRGLPADNDYIVTLANEIINSNAYQLEDSFEDVFSLGKHYTECTELMFSRPIDQMSVADMVGAAGGQYSWFNYGIRNNAFVPTNEGTGIYAELIEEDARYAHTWANMPVVSGNPPTEKIGLSLLKAWRIDGQLPSYLMRLSQVYLMKAEALLNGGAPIAEVVDIINVFRARSGNGLLKEEDLMGDRGMLREHLVYEYVLELGVENGCEYHALVRNRGVDGQRMIQRFNINYISDMQLALAIPHDETERDNGTVVQNPLFGN